jgi:hypothetical protein
MATIELEPDDIDEAAWRLVWVDRNEVVGRVLPDRRGRYRVAPEGPHWGPMKSFGGPGFASRDAALADVRLYFRRR